MPVAHAIEIMPYLWQSFRNPRTLTPEEMSGTRKTSLGSAITRFRQHLKDLDILKFMGLSWVALAGDGTKGQGHKLKPIKFLLNAIFFFFFSLWGWSNTWTGCSERFWSIHPWEILEQPARGETLPSVTSGGPCKDSGIRTSQGFLWGSLCPPPTVSCLITHTE